MSRRSRRSIGPAGIGGVVALWGAPSLVIGVQRGTITITGAATGTATITAVDTANSRIRFLGQTASLNAVDGTKYFARLALTNATTVTATVNASPGADSCTVGFEVTEYAPGVLRSVQRGTISCTGGSATATISAVNTSKSELSFLGFSDTDTSNNNGVVPRLAFTNATTVTASNVVAAQATVAYEVAEFF